MTTKSKNKSKSKSANQLNIFDIIVLGNIVKIMDIDTLIRIGHTTKEIQCNRLFPLLDHKIQELCVLSVIEMVKYSEKKGGIVDGRYFYADKKALNFIFKKYPTVSKRYWILAFIELFKGNYSPINIKRLKKIIDLLKLNNSDKSQVVPQLKEYASSVKQDNEKKLKVKINSKKVAQKTVKRKSKKN